jgi:hypothetical protein
MKKLNISWTVKKIMQKVEKEQVLFNHPMQRKSGQWDTNKQSLLIHSLLADYPVPPLYSVQDEGDTSKYSILDGKQRLTIIRNYMKDEFALTDVPEFQIDGVDYEISGLKFSELSEELRQEIEDFNLLMYIFTDCTDEDVEEIFYRMNNGVSLTEDQKTRAKLGSELLKFVDETLDTTFFKDKASFSKLQLKKAEDQTCILQTLMLLTDYKFSKFGNEDISKFVKEFRGDCNTEQLQECKDLFVKLDGAFNEKHKLLKKIHIPSFVMALKTSDDMGIGFHKFKEWIHNFLENYDAKNEYGQLCSGNTTNKEKVVKRLDFINNSLIDYVTQEGK